MSLRSSLPSCALRRLAPRRCNAREGPDPLSIDRTTGDPDGKRTMSDPNDLRDRAERLRRQFPLRRSATPPQENGRRIGTIERSETEQIRINWSEYEGKPFLSIRMWKRGDDEGWWPDGKRGISIRVRELPDLADGISEAIDLAAADRGRHAPHLADIRRRNPQEIPHAAHGNDRLTAV